MKIFLAVLCAVVAFGCASTQPVTRGTRESYSFGTYSVDYNVSLLELDTAIRETCKKAKLIENFRINREMSCDYQYRDVNGVRLNIEAFVLKSGAVRMKMRVGGTGDKATCQTLLIELEKHLDVQKDNTL